jgi:hypothetical protein
MVHTVSLDPKESSGKKLIKVGCYYVVSLRKGSRNIASLPQRTINEAKQDFEFKLAMANF